MKDHTGKRALADLPPVAQGTKTVEYLSYEIEVITPIAGGGVEAKTPDPVTPVRGTEIRGQLRFWWRATRGAAFDTVARLKEREDEIWGSTKKASQVAVEVSITDAGRTAPFGQWGTNR